jgi:hypothetical protein
MLPKLSGVDLPRALRQHAAASATPVMTLSSLPHHNRQKLVSEGATMFFDESMLETDRRTGPFLNAVAELLAGAPRQN